MFLALALLACGGSGTCNECSSPVVDATVTEVWVAQGRNVFRLDPATGVRRQRIEAWPETTVDRSITAILAAPDGVFIAWSGGTGVVRNGRVAHHSLETPLVRPLLVRSDDRVWLLGGRQLIPVNVDGTHGEPTRFRTRALAERAVARLTKGTASGAFGTTTSGPGGTFRQVRRDNDTVWVERIDPQLQIVLWRAEITPTT